jgi:hypothetical protein
MPGLSSRFFMNRSLSSIASTLALFVLDRFADGSADFVNRH